MSSGFGEPTGDAGGHQVIPHGETLASASAVVRSFDLPAESLNRRLDGAHDWRAVHNPGDRLQRKRPRPIARLAPAAFAAARSRRGQLRPSRKGIGDVSQCSGLLLLGFGPLLLESEPAVVEPPLPH